METKRLIGAAAARTNPISQPRLPQVAVRSSFSSTTARTMEDSSVTASCGVRSKQEIRNLVQARVRQRNAWLPAMEWPSPRKLWPFIWKSLTFQVPSQDELDRVFPVQTLDWEKLQNPPSDQIQVTWLGHASLLVQMRGYNILADPVFSPRCSPVQWLGPKRYRPPPCTPEELCTNIALDVVLISHNHYDHLDHSTLVDIVRYCDEKPPQFIVPLGLQEWIHLNVSKTPVVHELDWDETVVVGDGISVTAVPMRHWSNRAGNRDQTLWCGFSVKASNRNFLFPGDTAWFDEMAKLVGERYGPYDAAAIPIGAYEPRDVMKINHINVEEAIRMKDALRASLVVPIHWGTFPLTLEPVMEPWEKLEELMTNRDDRESFVPWLIGETKQTR